MTKMTPEETDKAADEMIVLIDRATMAIRAGKPDVAAELMQQVHALAKTLPTKEADSR